MATPAAAMAMSSTSSTKATQASLRKLLSHPMALNKTLTGLRIRPSSDYKHHWVPVPGTASKPASSGTAVATRTTGLSAQSAGVAPFVTSPLTGERTRMRWQQAKVSARVLADLRKKVARLERCGIALAVEGGVGTTTGPVMATGEMLNLPAKVDKVVGRTVRMGKPDKGRKHDRTAPLRKAKVAKAIAEMPKTIETWKKAKAAEKTKTASTLPF